MATEVNTSSFVYEGGLDVLKAAILKAVKKRELYVKEVNTESGLRVVCAETGSLLSTNWAVTYTVEADKVGNRYAVVVTGGSSMTSLTQSQNNATKVVSFAELIQVYLPRDGEVVEEDAPKEAPVEAEPTYASPMIAIVIFAVIIVMFIMVLVAK